MTVTRIIGDLTRTGISAVRHPVESSAYAAGLVKGVAYAVIRVASGEPTHRPTTTESPTTSAAAAPAGERTLFGGLNREAAPPQMPGAGGEAYEHFPSPESRDAGHGNIRVDPREEASWTEGLDEVAAGNPATASADATEPLIDPATTKAIRSEAETLQRAAELNKG